MKFIAKEKTNVEIKQKNKTECDLSNRTKWDTIENLNPTNQLITIDRRNLIRQVEVTITEVSEPDTTRPHKAPFNVLLERYKTKLGESTHLTHQRLEDKLEHKRCK